MEKPFAVFIVCRDVSTNLFCATTRDDKKIALPGGKVDEGETGEKAVLREAAEEGWKILDQPQFLHKDFVDGKLVFWYRANYAKKLENYKEKNRGIKPVVKDLHFLAKTGFGNDFLLKKDLFFC